MLSFEHKSFFDYLSERCEGWFWVVNRKHELIYLSVALSKSLELPTLNKPTPLSLIFDQDSVSKLRACCDGVAAGERAIDKLSLSIRGAGELSLDVLSDVTPWHGEHEALLGFYGVAKPTGAPALVQRQAEQLELLARVGRIGSWQYDLMTQQLVWDLMACELYGCSPDVADDASEHFRAVCHPDDLELVSRIFTAAIEGDTSSVEMEYRIIRANDGEVRHVHTSSTIIHATQTQSARVFGVIWDTTQDRLAEARLAGERHRLASIIEGTNVATWEWNIQTGQTRFDERWANIVGYTLQELEPTTIETWSALVHPEDGERSEALLARHFAGESDYYECEARMRHKDGSWRWVLDRGKVAQWDEQGQPLVMYGTHKEITERKHIQEELILANEANALLAHQAQAANEAKTEFLTKMSHELRTPLHGIMGTLELLTHTKLSSQQQNHLRILKQSAESLLELLNSLLDLAKVESGKLELEVERFELPQLIEEVSALANSLISVKPIQFINSINSPLPSFFLGDVTRLRQVLLNLVGNAIKFTERGSIRLNVDLLEQHEHLLKLRFSVEDTGVGIPDSKLEEVFNKFSQADSSTTRHYGGSGLGLAIVKQLTELMGGQVGVESELGAGARFWFTVALAPAHAGRAMEPANASVKPSLERSGALEGKRVLVFDDHVINQEIMLKMLRILGVHGACAQDVSQGLSALEHGDFDAVLMDVQMPELNGIELTRAIREGAAGLERSKIPIIVVSANATHKSREECFVAGADDFVSKPVTLSTLRTCLELRISSAPQLKALPAPRCFDSNFLSEQLAHDTALISALLDSFAQDMHKQLEALIYATQTKDLEKIQQLAHRIQGAASHVGALALNAQALAIFNAHSVEDIISRQLNERLSLELELFERVLATSRQAELP